MPSVTARDECSILLTSLRLVTHEANRVLHETKNEAEHFLCFRGDFFYWYEDDAARLRQRDPGILSRDHVVASAGVSRQNCAA